jgi:hypothetical protein
MGDPQLGAGGLGRPYRNRSRYFGLLKLRAHSVPTRTRNRAKYGEPTGTTAGPKMCGLPGFMIDLAGRTPAGIFPAFRPEKREVTGSTPVPTTGKNQGKGCFDGQSV